MGLILFDDFSPVFRIEDIVLIDADLTVFSFVLFVGLGC